MIKLHISNAPGSQTRKRIAQFAEVARSTMASSANWPRTLLCTGRNHRNEFQHIGRCSYRFGTAILTVVRLLLIPTPPQFSVNFLVAHDRANHRLRGRANPPARFNSFFSLRESKHGIRLLPLLDIHWILFTG